MEVQTLVMSENELGNIAITTPDGETIPILDTSSLPIAASNGTEASEQLNPYGMITPNGELAVETITFNVAEVFGEETNALVNSRQLHFIQHADGSLHPIFNSESLDEIKETDKQEINEISGEIVEEEEANEINVENTLENIPPYEIQTSLALQRVDSQHELSMDSQDIQNELTEDSGNNVIGDEVDTNAHDELMLSEDSRHSEITGMQENDEDNTNTVVIDVSNPIELSQNSLIVVNGKKCVLQQNLETGQLIAYPIKEPEKPPKRRGRPRRRNSKSIEKITGKDKELVPQAEGSSPLLEEMEIPSKAEPSGETGFVEKANEEGEIVKRSARKRKKTTLLAEYETSTLKFECSSDEEYTKDKEDAEVESVPAKRRGFRGRGRGGNLGGRKAPPSQIYPVPGKRGRGRPRRNGIKPPEQPATQTFLIHTADGQAIMIKVPVSSLSPGKSLQNTAQDIADSLNARTQNFLPLAPKPPPPCNPVTTSTESNGADLSLETENPIEEELVANEDELHPFSNAITEQQEETSYEKEEEGTENAIEIKKGESNQIDTTESNTTSALISNGKEEENLVNATAYPLSVIPFRIGLRAAENDLEKLKCLKCDFQAYYQKQYQEHIATHPDDVQQCKCCEFLSFSETELTEHYNEHHPKCICPICNHTAAHPYVIKRHMYRHSDVSSTCEICGKTYRDHYILKMHIKNVHMPAEEFFYCPTCSKQFTRKAHLKRHIRTHDPNKPYKCPQCDYRGSERSDITKHKLIHEDPKHTCEICLRTFRHIKNMELHMKRHNGQRDYKCGVCEFYGYTFTDIRKHIERRHADSKTILCGKCGQAFKTDQELQEHQSSDQCELFMLEQVLQEQEQMDDSSQPEDDLIDEDEENLVNSEDNQDCVGIGSITLTDDSIAALNVIQELNGHIVISGNLGEITAARLLETDGDENMLNDQDLQENQLTLIAGESHTEAEPLTILTSDIENKQFTIVADDCKSPKGAIMDDNITTSFINFEVSNPNET